MKKYLNGEGAGFLIRIYTQGESCGVRQHARSAFFIRIRYVYIAKKVLYLNSISFARLWN